MTGIAFHCPKCKSSEAKKVSLVYESGTFTGTVVGLGANLDGDFGIAGGITQKGSLLASRLAPPTPPNRRGERAFVTLAAIVTGACIWVGVGKHFIEVVILAPCAIVAWIVGLRARLSHRKRVADYLRLTQAWDRSWVCLKCGHTWVSS